MLEYLRWLIDDIESQYRFGVGFRFPFIILRSRTSSGKIVRGLALTLFKGQGNSTVVTGNSHYDGLTTFDGIK